MAPCGLTHINEYVDGCFEEQRHELVERALLVPSVKRVGTVDEIMASES